MRPWRCDRCDFELYVPIVADLAVSELGLHVDDRFPGRCIMMLRGHAEQLDELPPGDLGAFWSDAMRVGRAIRRVTGADRINYAVLGNTTPHLHVHLIPRRAQVEPLPTRPPWSDPRPPGELSAKASQQLVEQITRALV